MLLLFRALCLIPLLAAHGGFAQAMAMMGVTALYYFYYRGNNPFIKFEDNNDVERPNLHYKAEESKLALFMFMLVIAAVGSKSRDMIEICGWVFVLLNTLVLVLVLRNFAIGVKNVNEPPTEAAISLAQDTKLMELAAVNGTKKPKSSGIGHGGHGGGGAEETKQPNLEARLHTNPMLASNPSSRASSLPSSNVSSAAPSRLPSAAPSRIPSANPSRVPSAQPSRQSSRASSPIRSSSSRVEEISRDDLLPPGSRASTRPPSRVGSAATSPTSRGQGQGQGGAYY